jgi:beta-xylosidase
LLVVFTIGCERTKSSPKTKTVTINNVEPRRDVAGEIIDAHDGCLQFFNGRYYLYGTAYGKTDGFTNNDFRVYSSPDLEHWTFEGTLLKDRPVAIYFRPYVVFNPSTHKYVLWYNWYPNIKPWVGQAGVATSDSPVGPFTIVNPKAQLTRSNTGDGSLFVDDDGTGYFIYTAIGEGYIVRVERLQPDYLDSTGDASSGVAIGAESPVLFRRNGLYYTFCGPRCAFCPEGSWLMVYISFSPMGPYYFAQNLNNRPESSDPNASARETRDLHVPTPDGTFDYHSTNTMTLYQKTPNVSAQETWVARIPVGGQPAFIWMADRWQSTPDGIKGHDFQFWSAPLKFNQDATIQAIENVPQWQAAMPGGN